METTKRQTEESGQKSPKSPRGSPRNAEETAKIEEARKNALKGIQKRKSKGSLSNYGYHIVIGGFIFVCVAALISVFFGGTKKLSLIPVIDEEEISTHNQHGYSFSLGQNEFFQGWMLSDAKYIINNQLSSKPTLPRCMTLEDTTIIPEKYNTREQYPECARPIYNQLNCSSSYSVVAVSTLSDRYCIQTKGEKKPNLSAQTALSCDQSKNYGCKGGSVSAVFDYAKKQGLVDVECFTYSGDAEIQCPSNLNTCEKYHLQEYCVTSGEEGIKREIYKNGPVIAVIPVYRDFLVYKNGVYQVIEGTSKFHSGHGLKIIGWDKNEKGESFWIVENSWGESWGIDGFAHIAVGQKNLYIDDFVLAPHPKTDKSSESPEDIEPLGGETVETQDLDA